MAEMIPTKHVILTTVAYGIVAGWPVLFGLMISGPEMMVPLLTMVICGLPILILFIAIHRNYTSYLQALCVWSMVNLIPIVPFLLGVVIIEFVINIRADRRWQESAQLDNVSVILTSVSYIVINICVISGISHLLRISGLSKRLAI